MGLFKLLRQYSDSIVALSILCGGVMWLTAIYESVAEATRTNAAQDQELRAQMALLRDTHDSVIRIETKLSHLIKE